jgi:hypothetical protein
VEEEEVVWFRFKLERILNVLEGKQPKKKKKKKKKKKGNQGYDGGNRRRGNRMRDQTRQEK